MKPFFSTIALSLCAIACREGSASNTPGSDAGDASTVGVLVYSRTGGYRHDSISAATQALGQLAKDRGWTLSATEQPTTFSDSGLAPFDVVVFLNTTGEVLDPDQQSAMERFIAAGKGFVGVHAASDTEYDWPWYGELVGAYFQAHPAIQEATVLVEDRNHPATAQLPASWTRSDEWYGFSSNPRAHVNVLLALDEQSYSPGEGAMGGDHPIAWYHQHDGGRAFYTALGHTSESYSEPEFLDHLAGAIAWASGQR